MTSPNTACWLLKKVVLFSPTFRYKGEVEIPSLDLVDEVKMTLGFWVGEVKVVLRNSILFSSITNMVRAVQCLGNKTNQFKITNSNAIFQLEILKRTNSKTIVQLGIKKQPIKSNYPDWIVYNNQFQWDYRSKDFKSNKLSQDVHVNNYKQIKDTFPPSLIINSQILNIYIINTLLD